MAKQNENRMCLCRRKEPTPKRILLQRKFQSLIQKPKKWFESKAKKAANQLMVVEPVKQLDIKIDIDFHMKR